MPSIDTSTSSSEQKSPEKVISEKQTEEPGKKPEPDRKIIKFASPEKSSNQNKTEIEPKKKDEGKPGNIPDVNKIIGEKTPGASVDSAREELEQRRTILQNLKDFDFQIKKNQEDITNLLEKVESLSKDLDDLVSLYEIVSEQMNPFVGLSKVTKKRLDALENITTEVETIKTRVGDLELSLENGGGIPDDSKKKGIPVETNTTSVNTATPETTTDQIVRTPINTLGDLPPSSFEVPEYQGPVVNLSERELDEILSKSLEALRLDQNIDSMITDFFLTLK